MKTNKSKKLSSHKPGQKKDQTKKVDHSRDYLKAFISIIISLIALVYFVRFGFSKTTSAEVVLGQIVFFEGAIKDLLVFFSIIILLIFWMILTGREKKKLLIFIFLNLAYFFISYFSFFGISVLSGTIKVNIFFIISLLFFVLINYISVFIFAVKYINEKKVSYYEAAKCFGSRLRRKYYVQKVANKSFVVSQIGIILIVSIFSSILLNGSYALFVMPILFLFFLLLYFFSYCRLMFLKKKSGIENYPEE